MKKTFIKTVFKDLWHNLSRFIAIIAIVALGVGFLIGLLSTTPDLQHSLDTFYKNQNTQDILIKSTLGFDELDLNNLIEDLADIENIEGYNQNDSMADFNGVEIATRIVSFDFDNKINKLELVSGRLPEAKNECLALAKNRLENESSIGEKIIVDEEEYLIVGLCNSAVYYYKLLEPTTIGTGNLDGIIYLNSKYNPLEVITDIVITINNSKDYNLFSDEYFSYLDKYVSAIENVSDSYLNSRFQSLKEEAYLEIYPIVVEEFIKKIEENLPESLPEAMKEQIITQQLEANKELLEETSWEQVEEIFEDYELEWYILNLKSNASYVSFKENSNKVNNISVIFPFFFFFIAALIALTSITRMVSEDRSSIGTLKSLGYSNFTILCKYLFYALFACVIGSLIGVFTGVYILPIVIYNCYYSLFVLPEGIFLWNPLIIFLSSLSMILTIFLVMIFVCLKTLRERPNALLIPKAPKAGKRILLERIGFFWKHLGFKYKSALRNVFRFKQNLIMMIVGIGGCTALLLVAFGLKDSMTSFSSDQFENIIQYDLLLDTRKDIDFSILSDSETYNFYRIEGTVVDSDYTAQMYYVDETILDYMDLQISTFNKDSVVISWQLSNRLGLKKGSLLKVKADDEIKEYIVTDVFENYIDNYIIIHKEKTERRNNSWMIKFGENDRQNSNDIIASFYNDSRITKIEDVNQTRMNYNSISENIEIIIYVVILCSGSLAIIVIYNLTNININERIKEIATLKVLGYQRIEVLGYIFREIVFMSVLGIIFGFILGPILSYFVIDKISSIGQCFSTTIGWYNYIYAFLISFIFVIIVIILFIRKIRSIKMVESLKCVD